MTTRTAADLERALLRYGDDLYRLALLLTPDPDQAARALLAATRHLAISDAPPSEPAVLAALLAALPPERRRPDLSWLAGRLPAWARRSSDPAAPSALLAALARLPRPARAALDLALRRAFAPAQIAPLLSPTAWDGDDRAARIQLRDALRALAPYRLPADAVALIDPEPAPAACRPTRAALALGAGMLHADPGARGHLALCPDCRATEHAWQQLTAAVEAALRGVLREVRLPPDLAARLAATARRETPPAGPTLPARLRLALVALPVLALIAWLVIPRGTPPWPGGGAAAAPAADARALVRAAGAQLYQPPPGQGVWHSRYAIEWNFPDGSYAPLTGELWIDPGSGRHRAQLTHHDGGGPYEFALADGAKSAWYAVSESYTPSLYPFGANGLTQRGQFRVTPEQQRALLAARLQSGAWSIAAAYLRAADAAALRTWGRQRDADGGMLTLISFRGTSPLGLPADAPEAAGSATTILLAIDGDGRLREVRELVGADGTEQTARTTWRLAAEEWLADSAGAGRAFDLQRAWNGVGTFAERGALIDPAFPLLDPTRFISLATIVQLGPFGMLMPASAPPGADAGIALNIAPGHAPNDAADLLLIYTGPGRRMEIRTVNITQINEPARGGELVTADARTARHIRLFPMPGQRYHAVILPNVPEPDNPLATEVQASGYTRAELLGVLQSLGPPTLDSFRSQARLFYDPHPKDAAFEALLGALAPLPVPPSGGALHIVEQVFKRHASRPDPLADPYHRPPYGGWSNRWTQDTWARRGAGAPLETASTLRSADGTLLLRQYRGAEISWDYDGPADRVYQYASSTMGLAQQINEDQLAVLRMLGCGGYTLTSAAGGQRSVILSERAWRSGSCQNPTYDYLWDIQSGQSSFFDAGTDEAPYLADIQSEVLTTEINLAGNGRPASIRVWAGPPASGQLLEGWERLSEELQPAEHVPAMAFDARAPAAALHWVFPAGDVPIIQGTRRVTITETLSLMRSPLFVFPGGEQAPTLETIEAGPNPDQPRARWYTDGEIIFDAALRDGYLVRLTYTAGAQTLHMYEGPLDTLRAYLRSMGRWQSSSAARLQIGGKQVEGWAVLTRANKRSWLLFALDGTFIALEQPPPELMWVVAELQPIDKPRAESR